VLLTCQKCHPDATTNFSDAWLSHYIPDRERYPIVYYVNVFYKFFIPLVLGAMAIFVVTDAGRFMLKRRQAKNHTDQAATPPPNPPATLEDTAAGAPIPSPDDANPPGGAAA
jgi:hypothetical protein